MRIRNQSCFGISAALLFTCERASAPGRRQPLAGPTAPVQHRVYELPVNASRQGARTLKADLYIQDTL